VKRERLMLLSTLRLSIEKKNQWSNFEFDVYSSQAIGLRM
jgi:hypothetical protein